MSEYAQMLDVIKRAATDAVGAAKPFSLTYGTVTSLVPLKIKIDQKLELGPSQLLLTNAVRDYAVDMTVGHWTEDATCTIEHKHAYEGRKKFTVHFGLKDGEKVLLLRIQGGQQYIVLDRVVAPE